MFLYRSCASVVLRKYYPILNYVAKRRNTTHGDMMRLKWLGRFLKGKIEKYRLLFPEDGVKDKIFGVYGHRPRDI